MLDADSKDSAVNVTVFDNASGEEVMELSNIAALGPTLFSASDSYFVFSHLDGHHYQHFAIFDYR